jgi:hypothetical protein
VSVQEIDSPDPEPTIIGPVTQIRDSTSFENKFYIIHTITRCVNESGDLAAAFFPGLVEVGRMPLLPPSSLLQSVLGAMELWTGAQRAFAVKAFYKNGDSFVIAQREFRREF